MGCWFIDLRSEFDSFTAFTDLKRAFQRFAQRDGFFGSSLRGRDSIVARSLLATRRQANRWRRLLHRLIMVMTGGSIQIL
jgi:hypothetical protein